MRAGRLVQTAAGAEASISSIYCVSGLAAFAVSAAYLRRIEPSLAGPTWVTSRAKPSRAKPSQAEPSRAKPSRIAANQNKPKSSLLSGIALSTSRSARQPTSPARLAEIAVQ
jgi:hypothetical protein